MYSQSSIDCKIVEDYVRSRHATHVDSTKLPQAMYMVDFIDHIKLMYIDPMQ
jgi:hypothetical protein